MRAIIQRVAQASVSISGKEHNAIRQGFLVLLGIATADNQAEAKWLAQKIAKLRVFSDENGLMNLDLAAINGEVLVVSQFTLHAGYAKGNRPSFIHAARPEQAIPLYEYFVRELETLTGKEVKTGVFGADMQVALVNDGPMTVFMDSLMRE